MTEYAVKDLLPNPFRRMDRYRIRRGKVETLKESLRKTGFWDNVVARTVSGKAEIAYGHHRLVALKEEYGPNHRVNLIIRELDDTAMLQIMARENMEEWGTDFFVELETVETTLQAYAAERVDLPQPHDDTPKSYIKTISGGVGAAPRSYTDQSVADFIGWTNPDGSPRRKVRDALDAIELITDGLIARTDLEGLNTEAAQAVVRLARQRKEAQEAAARLAERQAEDARKEAKRLDEARREAEAQRKRHEIEAAEAKETGQRVAAEREAKLAGARAQQAEVDRQLAERRRQHQEAEADKRRKLARQQASSVGKHVSQVLKSGERGYRQARDIADEVIPMKQRPPKDINDHARQTAKQINALLDTDALETKVAELLKFHEHLEESVKYDLSQQLIRLADRARKLAFKFTAETDAQLLALPEERA